MLFMSCVGHAFASVAAFGSPAWKGLTSWLVSVIFNCVFCHFPMLYPGSGVVLDLSIADLCHLSYFVHECTPSHFIS